MSWRCPALSVRRASVIFRIMLPLQPHIGAEIVVPGPFWLPVGAILRMLNVDQNTLICGAAVTETLAIKEKPSAIGRMAHNLVPAVCDVSVTNLCNATCNFCSYAHDKGIVKDKRWIDRDRLKDAMAILHRRGRALHQLPGRRAPAASQDRLAGAQCAAGRASARYHHQWLAAAGKTRARRQGGAGHASGVAGQRFRRQARRKSRPEGRVRAHPQRA